MELVWNSEFHINEKASEIKQWTGIQVSIIIAALLPCITYTASAVEGIDHLRLIH